MAECYSRGGVLVNYASEDQLRGVAQVCGYFDPRKIKGLTASVQRMDVNNVTCANCNHWDGEKCVIDVFDKVLASIDQT